MKKLTKKKSKKKTHKQGTFEALISLGFIKYDKRKDLISVPDLGYNAAIMLLTVKFGCPHSADEMDADFRIVIRNLIETKYSVET